MKVRFLPVPLPDLSGNRDINAVVSILTWIQEVIGWSAEGNELFVGEEIAVSSFGIYNEKLE